MVPLFLYSLFYPFSNLKLREGCPQFLDVMAIISSASKKRNRNSGKNQEKKSEEYI